MTETKKRLAWMNCYPRRYPHENDFTVRHKYYQIFRLLRVLDDAEQMNKGVYDKDRYQVPALGAIITDNDTDTVYWLARESLGARTNKHFTGWVNYDRWCKYMDKRGWIPF
jgi:hypothetical protein